MIHRRIAEVAARRPDHPAVVARGERLSHGELVRRARALAAHLRSLGVGPEDLVAVAMERTVDLVAALLGVLESGAAYLPLDPAYPAERLAFMLDDSGARVVLAGSPAGEGAAAVASAARARGVRRVDLGPDGEGWPRGGVPGADPPAPAGPDPRNLAYLIYTSGSTGRPKGVAIEHRSADAMVEWALGEFSAAELAGTLAATSVCFDLSVFELFVPLAAGGTVILAEDALELPRLPAEPPVTLVNTVPSAMAELVAGRGVPETVRTVNLAGEALRRPLADAVYAATGARRLLNLYGPSEDTTYSTWEVVPRDEADAPSIGRPLPGTLARLLDPTGRPAPDGEAGDLHLGGDGLARGYLGRPALTAERFVPDPAGEAPGARLYRTGDLVRRLPDGRLHYQGRIDHQVKIRGFRIELGEVEAALLAHPAIHEAVVVAREGAGGPALVAYVAGGAPDGRPVLGAEALREGLGRSLPAHMVPSRFVVLEALPRTPNGKVDRAALPEPPAEAEDGDLEPPATAAEATVATLWREVLEVDRVGRGSHFLLLGGHSLLATRLLSRVRDAFGVELPMAALFEAPTLHRFAARIEAARGDAPVLPPLRPRPAGARDAAAGGEATLPPSYAQQRLWLLDRMQPGLATYNLPEAFRLRGRLHRGALARALAEVVRRHEALRTRFVEEDGQPRQRIEPPPPAALPVVDLGTLPGERRAGELDRLAAAEARRPFDLARGPVLRACLVAADRAGTDHLLLLTLHHVVADAWSQGVLNRELSALYGAFAAGRPSPLPDPSLQYADFARWQRSWPPGVLDGQLAFWRRRLAGASPLELPADRSRPAVQSFRGARVRFPVPPALAAGVERLARDGGATPFMAWLALFVALLGRHAGRDDLVVGAPVANRRRAELEGLIGFFVNLLPVRVGLAGAGSFRELLGRVRAEALAAFDHQDLPFERLVAELRPERDLSRNPVCQVAFQLLDRPVPRPELDGLAVGRTHVPSDTTRFDLALTLTAADGRLAGEIELARDLFDRTTVERMTGHLLSLAAAVAGGEADRPVDALPLLTRAERHALLVEPAGEPAGAGEPVHLRVLARAARAPDAVAVAGEGAHLTFGELARRSDLLAVVLRDRLRRAGRGPGTPVALCLERSPDLAVAALGALRAGASYLPLDPAYPRERLAFMAADAGAAAVVCRAASAHVFRAPDREVVVMEPDGLRASEGGGLPADPAPPDGAVGAAADPLAYVIYTSGSTGRPKGVGVGHRALANLVAWHLRAFRLTARDRATQLAQVGFDASVWELWPALVAGAPLHLPPEEVRAAPEALRDWLVARGITVSFAPTPLAEALVALPWPDGTALRTLLTGGDRLHAPPPARLPFTLVNDYGPTENAVVATSAPVPPDAGGAAPSIGRPVDGVRVRGLDAGLRPLPLGVPGELCLGGAGLARGYLGRPGLTAERFVPDPFASGPPGETAGARLYRTGDLARRRPDGSFDFLGRADRQVKVRGFRIEPGEVEAVLARHPAIREAAVVAPAAASGERRLVAYVVAADGLGGTPGTAELGAFLGRELPDYMVPAAFLPLESLPVTPSGKVDRRALAGRSDALEGAAEGVDGTAGGAPLRGETEELLAGIWRQVLGIEAVGRSDDFFRLGGHSLLAAQVVSRARDLLGVELPLRTLFTAPTLAALAEAVDAARRTRVERALPPLVPAARGPRSPLSSAQQRLWFLARLDPDDPTYNIPTAFRLRGPLDRPALSWSLGEVVRRHATLRTRFGEAEDGPYQEILPPAPGPPPVIDLAALPAERREAEAVRLVRGGAWRPFDLAAGALLRSLLIALDGGERPEHLLLLVMHHIASDGWSQAILHRELSALYRARRTAGAPASPLPEPPVQYADFAVWQRGWLRGELVERQLAYWKEQLAGAPAVLELPTDRPRPAVRTHRGAELPVALGPERVGPLRALARDHGVTLFMTLLAGFQGVLGRITGRRDVLVGSVVANRSHSEVEELIGFFVNALVMRGRLDAGGDADGGQDGEATFAELLGRVRRTALDAYDHQDLPFERLVDELQPERNLSHQPLIQVMFGLQNEPLPPLELPGVEVSEAGVAGTVARFDLTLALFDDGAGLHGVLEYNTDLFDRTTVARLSGHLETLLAGAAEDPGRGLGRLPLMTRPERQQVVREWNDTRRVARLGATVHGLVRERAALQPAAPAAVWRGRELSYGELSGRAGRLARFLAARGVGRGTPVGVWMERSLDMLTAVLGVLEAGGFYLPLDAAWPAERVETILAAHGAPVLLTRSERLAQVLDLRWRLPRLADVVCLDVETPEPPAEEVDRRGAVALWDLVAERATDRVSAAGFVSSFTGEPFTAAEVDEYRDRVVALAEPFLAAGPAGSARVLEIGCGSGLILWELAPRAARYVGVDPSGLTQERNREVARRRRAAGEDPGVDPDRDLVTGFAHELDALPAADGPFDLVIVASAVQFFPGPLYLERVLDLALRRLAPGGAVVVADVMDARRRGELEAAIAAHAGDRLDGGEAGAAGRSTQGQELFVDEGVFHDFAAARATVERVEIAHRTDGFRNELGFRYDVVLVRGAATGRAAVSSAPGDPAPAAHPARSRRLWTGWHLTRTPAGETPPAAAADPDDLAYVIHTSGSTGAPKGIAVQHRPVVHLIEWVNRTFGVGPADRLLFVTSLCFDLSVYDVFGVLAAGGTVHVASEEELAEPASLVRLLEGGEVTIWDSAPAALQQLVPLFPDPPAAGGLRLVLLSGDWIPVSLPDRVRRAFPGSRVVSLGGATEATIWSNWYPVGRVDPAWPSIPYGRPIDDARYHVLDRSLEPLPVGVPGDLFIGGDVLCVGYARRPALTAERFVPDPWTRRPAGAGARLYRTGDRARLFADGRLEFLGRVDQQVKVRGFRIELGEIEVTLERHPAVREAVVLALPATGGDRRLTAYVVPVAGSPAPAAELREHLRRTLPEYMVPTAFASVPAMPVTPNGKVDRQALAAVDPEAERPEAAPGAGVPASPTEELVAGEWREILEVGHAGPGDNFFALGGNSLLATQVLARLRTRFGIEIPLRALFQRPTLADLAAEVEAARGGATRLSVPPPRPRDVDEVRDGREGSPPLSFSQLRLWFLVQVDPRSGDYNLPLTLRWSGPLQPAVLTRALAQVVRRHEILRTAFVAPGGRPQPVVRRAAALRLPVVDLSGVPAAAREGEVRRLVAEDVRRPFDLARAPLLRVALLRLSAGTGGEGAEHLLRATVHHIVFDGWSLGVLTRELADLYRDLAAGRPPGLEELPLQYGDYAHWQQRHLGGALLDEQLAFWRSRLEGAPPMLVLPTDRPRPAVQSYQGGSVTFSLPPSLGSRLGALAAREGVTRFMVLLAAFDLLLLRITGQDDLSVGTFVANRRWREIEPLIGFFVNTLVLRSDLSGEPSFRELLVRVRETTLEAYEHQELPFERLLEELDPERDLSRTPLFQVMFGLQNFAVPRIDLDGPEGTSVEAVDLFEEGRTNTDLALWMWEEEGDRLRGWLQYNGDLFDGTTARRLAGHLESLLVGVAADPGLRLGELPLLGAAERQQVSVEWAPSPRPLAAPDEDGGETVVEQIRARAAERPDAVALVAGSRSLTFAELERRSRALADRLRAAGAAPGRVVAVCQERTPEQIVSFLAAQAAGAAYLPLDPKAPPERLSAVLRDAGAVVLVAGPREAARLEAPEGAPRVLSPLPQEGPAARGSRLLVPHPDSLAYVIYTSGSTGVPKGVPVSHRSLAAFTAAARDLYGLEPRDRVLQFASAAFDASVEEIFVTLAAGATLVLRDEAMLESPARFLELCGNLRLTVTDLPTAFWHTVAGHLDREGGRSAVPEPLRLVIIGGEAASPEAVAAWLRVVGHRPALVNTYGPTEATVVATAALLDGADGAAQGGSAPIGRSVAGARAHVVDAALRPVPAGVAGELVLGGPGLARGYLGRPALTAERFVPSAAGADGPGERLYRTGDLARRLPDGVLEFLGRRDAQVKIRGFRVEPGEIAAALCRHPAVREAVVVLRSAGEGGGAAGARLAAYYTADEPPPEVAALREHLRERLPAYMIPADYVHLEALPVTATGKVDAAALPAPPPPAEGAAAPPTSPTEELIARAWCDLLGLPDVGVYDDFFDLGGHSLLAPQLVARLEECFEVALPLPVLFQAPTVAELAVAVERLLLDQIEALSDEEIERRLEAEPSVAGPV